MRDPIPCFAVLPALDEEGSVGAVIRGLTPHVEGIVVADNGSRDRTSEVARAAGAEVILQPQRGYGAACLAGVRRARERGAGILLFLDADGSDDPALAPDLLGPVRRAECDLVLGVRTSRSIEPGSMTPVQRFGNWFAPRVMKLATGAAYRDMPPFKAISMAAFDLLAIRDRGHGFTIEMLLRAHHVGLRVQEVVVPCRARTAGISKVSGTFVGSARAATKILGSIAWHGVLRPRLGFAGDG